MRTELEKLWLTVEATARVRDDLLRAIVERFLVSTSVELRGLTASEQYLLEQAEFQLQRAKADYQEAVQRWNSRGDAQIASMAHARGAELQNRIHGLENRLRNTPRCEKCGEYVAGHATGGDDICTCK